MFGRNGTSVTLWSRSAVSANFGSIGNVPQLVENGFYQFWLLFHFRQKWLISRPTEQGAVSANFGSIPKLACQNMPVLVENGFQYVPNLAREHTCHTHMAAEHLWKSTKNHFSDSIQSIPLSCHVVL